MLCIALLAGGCEIKPSRPGGIKDDKTRKLEYKPPPKAHSTKLRFDDVTARTGINFTPTNGRHHRHLSTLEVMGTGVALFDFDRDGDLDLFACGGGTFTPAPAPVGVAHALFRNAGGLNFRSVETEARIKRNTLYSQAAIVGDYDNDGFRDMLVTGYGGLLLYHNNGDGTFSEVARAAGLVSPHWNATAGWGDLDGDGNLDLYVARYVNWSFQNHPVCRKNVLPTICPPERFSGLDDRLFLSTGDGGFRDHTRAAGLLKEGKGLGVILGDIDLDGDLDIYVANDLVRNFLYLNDGKGRLREVAEKSGTAFDHEGKPDGSMGVALGDYNNDGRPDIWVTNFEQQLFALYRNKGDVTFAHESQKLGIGSVGKIFVGFGTVMFDIDLDGDEDIFATNGHVLHRADHGRVRQPPLLFENLGGTGFVNVAPQAGAYLATNQIGRGVAMGDLDGDGDEDLVIAHLNEPMTILSNVTPTAGNALRLTLIGTRSPRDAVGAVITIRYAHGLQMRQVVGGGSYFSSSTPTVTFGLRDQTTVQEVRVRWPSGKSTVLKNQKAGSRLLVEP